jgi:ectoine hydroxylase
MDMQVKDLYPSRTGGEARWLPRIDPVVWGKADQKSDSFTLNQEQLNQFDDNGYIILDGAAEDLVAPIQKELEAMKEQLQGREEMVVEPDSKELRSIFQPHFFSDYIQKVARDPRMLNIARQLLGDEVYLHQSRVNVKPGMKGRSFPWHSDFETWHVEDGMPQMRAVTGWIMLTENDPFNGPLFLIPGSHKHYLSCGGITPEDNYKQSLRKQEAGTPNLESLDWLIKEGSGLAGAFGKPGTIVFHECNIMHGSPDNLASYPRTNLFFVYNSVKNVCKAPFSGQKPRPSFLASRDTTPLEPLKEPLK